MSQFLSYIHWMRGIAILFVVGVHARGGLLDWQTNQTTLEFLSTFFDAFEGNGTVMFVFIGGFLFQHLHRKGFEYGRYMLQKFKTIILPYILISIPIILVRINTHYESHMLTEGFYAHTGAYQFFYYLLTGSHMAPFWFISTIILFYFSAPLLYALDKPWFYRYLFPFLLLAGMFTYRSLHNANTFLSYLHYLPVYVAGMWASRYKERIFTTDLVPFWTLFTIYLGITVLELRDILPPRISFEEVFTQRKLIFNWYLVRALVLCFMLAMLFFRITYRRIAFLDILAEYSFGIFFVHFLIIALARKVLFMFHIQVDFNLATFLIFFFCVVAASTITVYLIKRITGSYSRHLIGS